MVVGILPAMHKGLDDVSDLVLFLNGSGTTVHGLKASRFFRPYPARHGAKLQHVDQKVLAFPYAHSLFLHQGGVKTGSKINGWRHPAG